MPKNRIELPMDLPEPNSKGVYRRDISYDGGRYTVRGKSVGEYYAKLEALRRQLSGEEEKREKRQNPTVKQWGEECFEAYIRPRNSEEVNKDYAAILDNHVYSAIGHLRMPDVQHMDLQKILNGQAGKSGSHLKKVRMLIQIFFRKALQNRIIKVDPSIDLQLPDHTDGTHRALSAHERMWILYTAAHHFAGPWVLVLLYMGLRPQESVVLEWTDFNFETKVLHITKALKSDGKIGTPKSEAGQRDLPIPDILYPLLLAAYKVSKTRYVFTQQTSTKRHTTESLRCYWKSFLRQLDIDMGAEVYRNQIISSLVADDLTPYCLRHTYCTDLQDAGVPINVAKYLMGHADISVTAKIYTHQTEVSSLAARDAINVYHSTHVIPFPDIQSQKQPTVHISTSRTA